MVFNLPLLVRISDNPDNLEYEKVGRIENCLCGIELETRGIVQIVKEENKSIQIFQKVNQMQFEGTFKKQGNFCLYRHKIKPTEIIAVREDHICKASSGEEIIAREQASLTVSHLPASSVIVECSAAKDPRMIEISNRYLQTENRSPD